MNVKIISNKLLKTIKRLLKIIFFEEVEEANKLLKEQELKNMETTEKKDDSLNEIKMSIKSFNKATIPDKNKINDLNISKNMSNEERALSQGVVKNIDEQVLNSESNKSNNENSNNNSGENNLENNKTENNISQNITNEIIDKANEDSTNIIKEKENDI